MAIIIGRDKKKQKRVEREDVSNGLKQIRMAAAERKEARKVAAEAEAKAKEAAKSERKRGRKPIGRPAGEPTVVEADDTPADESTGVVDNENADVV